MIVAIGIFLTALLIILGALVAINNAARKMRSERVVADNLSAAIDSMSRNIRVGSNLHCGCDADTTTPKDCPMSDTLGGGGDMCIAFESQLGDPGDNGDQIIYKLSGTGIERSTDNGATYLPLTAPELNISTFKFYVFGSATALDQPVVTMIIRGTASTNARTMTKFDVQTTVNVYTPKLNI
ncbi:MAG: hypothetical protein A2942_02235 [Candidatus Lloydbacteria bacterium RIFCSPLOWO2_01_FULL_50_20]|uniref:Uncharacterized protein n=1 Tax=Candidatus Lloydbacteria bacterium RIFCSPLOWO2_01_FULL_50_20 TaxID=1798665 RepID=A0A1G2DGD0_9BACT|nr:MAG: hypothetical protein A2942_02235 [Candidatus Lloydbacteria bacterium RIFCSPLOWO2_01_FULL_50_20]